MASNEYLETERNESGKNTVKNRESENKNQPMTKGRWNEKHIFVLISKLRDPKWKWQIFCDRRARSLQLKLLQVHFIWVN